MTRPEEVFGGIGIVPAHDIEPGMFVAAVERSEDDEPEDEDKWTPHQGATQQAGMPVLIAQQNEEDDLEGLPLYVAHVSPPLVAVVVVPDGRRTTRDMRDFNFVKVDPGFAAFMVHEEFYQKRYPDIFDSGKVNGKLDLIQRSARASEARGKQITEALSMDSGEATDGGDEQV